MKWDYFIAYCYFEEKCKLCNKKNHWVLDLYDDKHHWLVDGLKILGDQGWELVAVQNTFQYQYGGNPPFYYIFKKPKD